MAYYVSAETRGKRALVLGPFREHGDALVRVEEVRSWCERNVRDVDAFDTRWGTCHHRAGHPAGRMNDHFGVRTDDDGFILATVQGGQMVGS